MPYFIGVFVMNFFFSRRAFNSQTGYFTNHPAMTTRYVGLGASDGKVSRGGLYNADKWAEAVHDQSGNDHVVIYVHGFNTKQASMLNTMTALKKGLSGQGFNAAVAAFDWPSDGIVSPSAYKRDRKDAETVAMHMILDGVKLLQESRPSSKVHLVAHSMGAYATIHGWGKVGHAYFPAKVDQAVFVAADVDQNWLLKSSVGGRVMQQRCNRLTHYYSSEDMILDISGKLVNSGTRRSGRHGLGPWPAPVFKDVSCVDRYLTDNPQRKRTESHSHSWYFKDDQFYKDLAKTLSGASDKTLPTRERIANGDQRLVP
jgi:esterase/lipase superfamily enzyme